MKNINADTAVVRLRTKQKALYLELNRLKREVVTQLGTERKKRYLLKQIESTENNIEEINQLIREEKKNLIKQLTQNPDEMFSIARTTPKKLNTTFVESTEQKDRQPTIQNLDQDIIERNISSVAQTQTSSNIPSIAFTIPISDDGTTEMASSISHSNTQKNANQSNQSSLTAVKTVDEESTGAIKRTNKVLDFSKMDRISEKTHDPFELPRHRKNDDNLNLNFPSTTEIISSDKSRDPSKILSQMNVLSKPSIEEINTGRELDKFFNALPPTGPQKSQHYHTELDVLNTNLASNFPSHNISQRLERSMHQSPQIPVSMETPHRMQQSEYRNTNANISIHSEH